MAFIVEDGTGLPDANAYISVMFFKDHHADRGRNVTSLGDAQIQVIIVRATDYLDKRFGRRFRGVRTSKDQALEWPRLDAFDNDDFSIDGEDDVPRQLQKACAEYAFRAQIYGELAPDPLRPVPGQNLGDIDNVADQDETIVTGQVASKLERVEGAVTESNSYFSNAQIASQLRDKQTLSGLVSGTSIPEYPEADLWLEELLEPPSARRIVRSD